MKRCSVRSPPVKVIVGGNLEVFSSEFFIPEEMLIQHSDFAAAALKSGWRESQQRTIELPTQESRVFEIFANFVCTGKIHSFEVGDISYVGVDKDFHYDKEWHRLGDCWLLGDMLQSCSFKDAVTDAIVQKHLERGMHPTELWESAYGETVGENGFRRLVVDFAAFEWTKECFQECDVETPSVAAFLRDTNMRFLDKGSGEENPLRQPGCRYHDHGREKPCYKTMF